MEEEKVDSTIPAPPSDYELAHDYKPTEGLTQEEVRREIAKTNEDPTHAYWDFSHRSHNEAVERMTRLYKIKTPEHSPKPGEISKNMDLKAANISEADLVKSDQDVRDLIDQENWDRAVKPLQAEWGPRYEEKMDRLRQLVAFVPTESRSFLDDSEDDVPALGNDPDFSKALDVVAEMIQKHEQKLKESRQYKSKMKGKK